MDYGKACGSMSDPTPMSLKVVDLSTDETRSTLEAVFGEPNAVLDTILVDAAPGTWTVAVLSDLKPRGRGIQLGRLRWILRAALPLGDQFTGDGLPRTSSLPGRRSLADALGSRLVRE